MWPGLKWALKMADRKSSSEKFLLKPHNGHLYINWMESQCVCLGPLLKLFDLAGSHSCSLGGPLVHGLVVLAGPIRPGLAWCGCHHRTVTGWVWSPPSYWDLSGDFATIGPGPAGWGRRYRTGPKAPACQACCPQDWGNEGTQRQGFPMIQNLEKHSPKYVFFG